MLLHNCTWKEVEERLQNSKGIMVPIGSTEQHGPNGLIGTDAICAAAIAAAAGDELDVLVAPTIPVGMAQHHMAFAGSMTVRPSTLIQLINDWVTSLSHHGFTHFYFINGHGGNTPTVTAAFDELYAGVSLSADGAPHLRCRSVNWWQGKRTSELRKKLYGAKEGAHATPSEVALTQYIDRDTIKNVPVAGTAPPPGSFADAADFREKFPDGRMGSDPTLANPEDGGKLLQSCVEDVVEDYNKFVGNAA